MTPTLPARETAPPGRDRWVPILVGLLAAGSLVPIWASSFQRGA